MIEQTSIKEIKGVGEKTQKLFEKVGIYTGVRYEKYAGDNRAYQRFDRDHSSDLVSYAIFKKYIKERSACHPSRQSYKAQESPRNGTPGDFLSAGQIR